VSKADSISEETRAAIAGAAWALIAEQKRADVSISEIATRAGVSRQSVYLAFGSRAGLLVETLTERDRKSPAIADMIKAMRSNDTAEDRLVAFTDAWLRYQPDIYPVGILIDAAALNDADASGAWADRMNQLRGGYRDLMTQLRKDGRLKPPWTPDKAADVALSLVHPVTWRLLVVEQSWKPAEFRKNRIDFMRTMFLA
jgi:AcrR family transcriptional regulator